MDKVETLIQGNFEFHRLNSVSRMKSRKPKTFANLVWVKDKNGIKYGISIERYSSPIVED